MLEAQARLLLGMSVRADIPSWIGLTIQRGGQLMSWTKCDCHDRTYTGKASSLYASLHQNGERETARRKLCPSGLSDLLGVCSRYLTSHATYDGDGSDLFQTCGWCGQERGVSGGAAVFVTVYKLGKEREDFAGCACDTHVAQARQDALVAV